MNCPTCKVTLLITNREGIEIDYCPQCRGVWLDRGELDKIIERSASLQTGYRRDKDDDDDDYKKYGGYKKPKKSFLHDIFDIG